MNPLLTGAIQGYQSTLQQQIDDPNLDPNSRSLLQQRLQGSLQASQRYTPSNDAGSSDLPDLNQYIASRGLR